MNRQLTIFDSLSSSDMITLNVAESDSRGFEMMDEKGIILNHKFSKVTKEELVNIYEKAISIVQRPYGYSAVIPIENKWFSVFFRFGNTKTRKNKNVFEFIEKHWEHYFKKDK